MAITNDTQTTLLKLSELLCADKAVPYKALFDEFMREQEFGLALHAVCDYLADEGKEVIDSSNLTIIEALHRAMRLEDKCIAELEKARFQKSGIPIG